MKYMLPFAALLMAIPATAQTVSDPTPVQTSPNADFAGKLAMIAANVMDMNASLQKQLVAANAEIAELKKKLNIPVEPPKPAEAPVAAAPPKP